MQIFNRDAAIKKIIKMPEEQVLKILIFMAGMEAEQNIKKQNKVEEGAKGIIDKPCKPSENNINN